MGIDRIALRMKCLELAFQCAQFNGKMSQDDIIKMAKAFEEYAVKQQ